MLHDIGDEPGSGRYRCKRCRDWSVTLEDGDRLPPCGKCGNDRRVTYTEMAPAS